MKVTVRPLDDPVDGPLAIPVESRILTLRGTRVLIDSDLASLYGTTTRSLNQQVRRNRSRFPLDFAWALAPAEKAEVIANCDHLRNLKYSNRLPMAFTEHGAIMVANVLNSDRAIAMSVFVVRAFVRLRNRLGKDREIAEKVAELEQRVTDHDDSLRGLLEAIRQLLEPRGPEEVDRPRIGFRAEDAEPPAPNP